MLTAALARMKIVGLRGFAESHELFFGIPNGHIGSGLTILVGPNSGGKSTLIEAIQLFAGVQSFSLPTLTEGKRNNSARGLINVELVDEAGRTSVVTNVGNAGGVLSWSKDELRPNILVMPSRRHFEAKFVGNRFSREDYATHLSGGKGRSAGLGPAFGYRLMELSKNPGKFNELLARTLNFTPDWQVELNDHGQYYLKITTEAGLSHSADGAGEGITNLFTILDTLHDSVAGAVIVIDEPEVSLHPAVQRRLSRVLAEFAMDRQILVATHSPYFVEIEHLINGAALSRVHVIRSGSSISALRARTVARLRGVANDRNNPHVLGTNAREAFFADDHIILVEGQDDVIHYDTVFAQVGRQLRGDLFGWGVGGADKMELIAQMLHDLGFARVVGILDSDKAIRRHDLSAKFPDYEFFCIPAHDVRTKRPQKPREFPIGLLDEALTLRPEFRTDIAALADRINDVLSRS